MSLFPLLLAASTVFLSAAEPKPAKTRLVAKLIHRDSIFHPQYNPNDTIQDRAARSIASSVSRLARLYEAKAQFGIVAELSPDKYGAVFLAEFRIGHPAERQVAIIDTGSDLLWVQCLPCRKCFRQPLPMFDPSKSSTFSPLSCHSPQCHSLGSFRCDLNLDQCQYSKSYMGDVSSRGVLATEQITFETSNGGTVVVQNLTFGCGHENDLSETDGVPYSVLGLNNRPLSIASQLGNVFSYCIGSISDTTYNYNSLVLGNDIYVEGDWTPLELVGGEYHVTLEGISMGEKRLDIDAGHFRRSWRGGGVIIDSGTTITLLIKEAYYPLRSEIMSITKGVLTEVEDEKRPWRLCYRGEVGRELVGFPLVTFHFAGGAELALDATSMFQQGKEEEFCLAVHLREFYGHLNGRPDSIIGVMAQQNYNVAFDMRSSRIYFQRMDCEVLAE